MTALGDFLNVPADDMIYFKLLLFSCCCAAVTKRIPLSYGRDWVSAFVGLTMCVTIFGGLVLYSLFVVLMNLAVLMWIPPRRTPLVSFIVTFGYLTFVRFADYLGLPKPVEHANVIQLFMALRCIGLVFEVSDARLEDKSKTDSTASGSVADDGLLSYFLYLYNFAGLFTGPYYSYRVHRDMVTSKYLYRVSVASEIVPKLMVIPVYIAVMVVVGTFFPLSYIRSEEFHTNSSFWWRLAYMAPVFVYFRMRVYIGWTLGETACIFNGLGAYPAVSKPKAGRGPTDFEALRLAKAEEDRDVPIKYSFETISNLDVGACEMADTFRGGMRGWNRSVQYWLATYVYRRCPSNSPRVAITMLVSAFWHGVHPGYYLSFLTVPLCTYVEDLWFKLMRQRYRESSPDKYQLFRHCWWFLKMRGFDYMSTGFLLLSWHSTTRYWLSIGCALQTTLLVLLALGYLLQATSPSKKIDKPSLEKSH